MLGKFSGTMRRLLALSLVLTVAGCSSSADLCATVKCPAGKVCDPKSGTCIANPDAGSTGGGAVDSGVPDAGYMDAGTDCAAECTSDAGTPLCDRSLGVCVQCLDGSDCSCLNGGPVCSQGRCVSAPADAGFVDPIAGESCVAPTSLFYPVCALPRSFTVDANLSAMSDDEQGSCSTPSGRGPDAVYEIDLDETYDLSVTVTPTSGTVAPVVYVRRDACESGVELLCKQGAISMPLSFTLKSLPAGRYFLFVDTLDATTVGNVGITVNIAAPTRPGNETCTLAIDLPADGGNSDHDGGVELVDFSNAGNEDTTGCNAEGGPDVVYTVTLDQTADLLVTATGVGDPGAGISPVVEVRAPDCKPTSRLKCRASLQFQPAQVRLLSAAPGTYYVVVETGATTGPVLISAQELTATAGPANESCATHQQDLPLSTSGGTATADPDTSNALDNETGSCTPGADGGTPELVYHFQLLTALNVVVQAVPDYQVQPVLYLRTSICEGAELGCVGDAGVNGTAVLDAGRLTPGDYYLFVETPAASSGLVHVTLTATP
jgi:hypothetical protein